MIDRRDGGGGPPHQESATAASLSRRHSADAENNNPAVAEPADSAAAIAALVSAKDNVLAEVLHHDPAVRRALRRSLPHHPADRELEQARTLVAVARIEHRRRHRSADLLAQVLAAARGCR
jgi:hypothetical protein